MHKKKKVRTPQPPKEESDSDWEEETEGEKGKAEKMAKKKQLLPTPDVSALQRYHGKRNIPGLFGNLFFYAHGVEYGDVEFEKVVLEPEEVEIDVEEDCGPYESVDDGDFEEVTEGTSNATSWDRDYYTNPVVLYECDLVAALCRHFILNDLRAEQLRIMSNSAERLKQIRQRLNSDPCQVLHYLEMQESGSEAILPVQVRVTILVLARTPASDDEDIFVRSILQAINASQNGVLIIASFRLVSDATSKNWIRLLNSMYRLNYIHPYLRLHCSTHRLIVGGVKTPSDLKDASPLGGCRNRCKLRTCGHPCPSICHPSYAEYHEGSVFLCREPCQLTCSRGHGCIAECHDTCRCRKGCLFLRECGHVQNHKQPCDSLCLAKLGCGRHYCQEECVDCKMDPKGHEGILCDEIIDHNCASGRHPCPPHSCSVPCTPCPIVMTHELRGCRHVLVQPCSEPYDEDTYFCKEPCRRRYGMCGHPCRKLCGEECGVCEVITKRPHPVCGHLTDAQCNVPIRDPCMVLVPSPILSLCGHEGVPVPCSLIGTLNRADISEYCFKPCDRLLTENDGDCGHYCFGNCYDCNNGKMHVRCGTSCGKQLLCGHSCRINCPLLCPPCIAPCMSTCEHAECPYECGVPCENACKEACPYSCPHLTCTQICGEACNRPGCFEPCPKTLDCGHTCAGFCGETCPKGCRLCSPELLIDFSGLQPEEVLDECFTYICIQPCGHSVEEGNLTQWMNLVDEGREIKYKCCPVCVTPIGLTLRRYSTQIQEAWRGVQEAKKKILGSEEEIEKGLEKIKKEITHILEPEDASVPLTRFINHGTALLGEVTQSIKTSNMTGEYFESMYMDKVNFIQWAVTQWVKAETTCSLYDHIWNSKYLRRLERGFEEVFRLMMSGYWPLHPNEVHSVVTELDRVADLERLYDRLSLIHDDRALSLGNSREGQNRFRRAEDVLYRMGRYSPSTKAEFKEKFMEFCVVQNYTLNISEKERVEIVQAFGSRAGRWFKCPNGHVYVVTECGGMTELGQCNECGAIIGGEQHRLLQFNQLASEMDGAEKALWPTALDP